MLQSAVVSGTARRADIGRPAAGKTGTTQSNRDGWFLGFTADLTAGVWMGRDDNKAVSGLAGGAAPTLAWAEFMREATRGLPVQPLFVDASGLDGGEPDDEAYGLIADDELAVAEGEDGYILPDGEVVGGPVAPTGEAQAAAGQQGAPRLDDAWLQGVLDGNAAGASAAAGPNANP